MSEPAITRRASKGSKANGRVRVLVVHDEEYPLSTMSAENIAGYFAQASAGGSAHYVIDADSLQHCVPDSVQAWHAPPNAGTLGWERDGYASWSREQWTQPGAQRTTCNVAASVAIRARDLGVPVVWLTAAQQRAGAAGITSHAERSRAFGQSDHSDPGPNFPVATFVGLVARAHAMLADVRACQAKVGAKVDGDAGAETALRLGAYLYGSAPIPTQPAPPPRPTSPLGGLPLAVDGVPGLQTWAALQRAVGASVDGIPGPETWRAVQRRVGVAADGVPGPITWRAVQRRVGVPQDGDPGPITWRAVQAALNARRF